MSETQTVERTVTPEQENVEQQVNVEAPEQTSDEPETQATPTEIEPSPKPRRADRHVANLTARLAAKEAELQEAERARQAAEAMLQAARDGSADQTPRYQQPASTDIEARADEIARQREFNRRLADIDAIGKRDAGGEVWESAKAILTGLGATQNQAFLEALAETSNPSKIFTALADDSDEVVSLLRKSPAAMAAHLGRLDAKMETTTSAPRTSNAPKPPAPLRTPSVQPEPDLYDEKLSMKEWAALWDKQAPRSLGGRRQ